MANPAMDVGTLFDHAVIYLQTRKSLVGSVLPVADLDQIIRQQISNIISRLTELTRSNATGDGAFLLSKLGPLRQELVAANFDMADFDNMMKNVIGSICQNKGLVPKESPKQAWSVSVSKYSIGKQTYPTRSPSDYLELVAHTDKSGSFTLHNSAANLPGPQWSLSFKASDILGISWSRPNKTVFISSTGNSCEILDIFIELTCDCDIQKLFEKLKFSGYKQEITCVKTKTMETMWANQACNEEDAEERFANGTSPLSEEDEFSDDTLDIWELHPGLSQFNGSRRIQRTAVEGRM
ncbi:MAG: hypothetical protein Q9216_005082 [Gyalolechia sp. 2 TL-2023]